MNAKYGWMRTAPSLAMAVVVFCHAATAQERLPNSQEGRGIAPATAGLPQASGNEIAQGTPAWDMVPVFTGGFTVGLRFGDGRGDATVRLYSTQITNNTIREFTYDGAWTNTSNFTLPFYSEGALLLGDGRGDGGAHLYAAEFSFGGAVRELTWDGTSWASNSLPSAGQQLIGAEIGAPRGDPSTHLYFSTGSSPAQASSHEYTYDGASWGATRIQPGEIGGFGIAIGDARNDGVPRLYQGVSDRLFELSWDGSAWTGQQIAGSTGAQLMALAVGDARNEGINHLYALARSSGIREYSYDGTAWVQTDNIAIGSELFHLAIGPGQNDAYNRFYVAQYNPGRLLEVTFDGSGWQTQTVATSSGPVLRVSVGDARGDAVNRVYASGAAGVAEFTHF